MVMKVSEQEALSLLVELLALPDRARPSHLDSRCEGREPLRLRVERLLEAVGESSAFPVLHLEKAEHETRRIPECPDLLSLGGSDRGSPAAIGPYRLLDELGKGGMGVVYRAQQEQPRREVALKILQSAHLQSKEFSRRFEREVEILGRFDHPGIARIYDAGTATLGGFDVPYIAMELVDGVSLREHVEQNGARLDDKLALIAKMADAVHCAHLKAVVHRDLKPGNILVTASGDPKILDFGIATSTEMDLDGAYRTQTGELLGTLAYMSPEQARCDADQIDARSDIYALGLIGYEILCGRPAFEGRPLELLKRGIEPQEVPALQNVNPSLHPDLGAIVGKACRWNPTERYESAGAFADDVRRFIEHRPILARPPSALYELRTFIRRHRAVVGALALAFVTLLVGGVASVVGFVQASRNAEMAEARAADLERTTDFQSGRLGRIDLERMALDFREGLLSKVREASGDPDGAESQEKIQELERILAGADFPGLALDTLRLHVFDPALEEIEDRFPNSPLIQADLLQTMATTFLRLGMLESARSAQARVLELRKEHLGAIHDKTLDSLREMSRILTHREEYEEAYRIAQKALADRRKVSGVEHPSTLRMQSAFASILKNKGDLEEARALFEENLASWNRSSEGSGLSHLSDLTGLASTLWLMGEFDAARRHAEQAIRGYRKTTEGDEGDQLAAMGVLAVTLFDQGDLEGAREAHQDMIEICLRIYGAEHPTTLTSQSNLAGTLLRLGDLRGARDINERVVEVRRRLQGDDDLGTLRSMGNLATVLMIQGEFEDSRVLNEQVFESLLRVRGERHAETMTAMTNLAVTLSQIQSRRDGARALHERALEGRRELLGEQHPDTLNSLSHLAAELQFHGDLQGAKLMQQEAVDLRTEVLGEDHPDTLSSMNRLASVLGVLGEYDEAVVLHETILESRRDLLGEEHPSTLETMANLAQTFYALGDLESARDLVAEALDIARDTLEENVPVRGVLEQAAKILDLE